MNRESSPLKRYYNSEEDYYYYMAGEVDRKLLTLHERWELDRELVELAGLAIRFLDEVLPQIKNIDITDHVNLSKLTISLQKFR